MDEKAKKQALLMIPYGLFVLASGAIAREKIRAHLRGSLPPASPKPSAAAAT